MIQPPHPYNLRPLRVNDIPQVMEIEERVFPLPWPAYAYEYELTRNALSHCYALERAGEQLVGYGCFWLIVDEAHISTLAVAERWRGQGLGELLVLAMIHEALGKKAAKVTLEVRPSNQSALALYAKFGLQVVGRRKRYYRDNQEDALIMTVEPLDEAYIARLAQIQSELFARLNTSG